MKSKKNLEKVQKLLNKEGVSIKIELIEKALIKKPKKIVFLKDRTKKDLLDELYNI